MKIQTFSVSAASLNTHTAVTVQTYLNVRQFLPYYNTNADVFYAPKRIQFINRSAVDVKVNILSNSGEVADYTANPGNYSFYTVVAGTGGNPNVVQEESLDILPQPHTIVVYAPSGVATNTFDIECIGYQQLI